MERRSIDLGLKALPFVRTDERLVTDGFDGEFLAVAQEVIDEHETFDDQLSIVEFLRIVRAEDRLPMNVTVEGLDDILTAQTILRPSASSSLLYWRTV